MHTVNMFDAKSSLSRLVEAIEQGREREIVIARNGRRSDDLPPAAARLVEFMAARALDDVGGLKLGGEPKR